MDARTQKHINRNAPKPRRFPEGFWDAKLKSQNVPWTPKDKTDDNTRRT